MPDEAKKGSGVVVFFFADEAEKQEFRGVSCNRLLGREEKEQDGRGKEGNEMEKEEVI